ncbi:uncharacterized protein At5g65660-like [Curcuma longa]|uniref:uncharacterized protein At5g65660-like n=1 Tax=Curcuma longa TaxID=136217 RepID=UPI003D9DF404
MDGGWATSAAQPAAAEHHGSRPTVGFPLGTALLLVVIFCLSGVFALCYHWEKLRSFRGLPNRSQQQQQQLPPLDALEEGRRIPLPSSPSLTSKLTPKRQDNKEEMVESLAVVMPGDKIAKFMAWPCPCQHRSPVADAFTATIAREEAISSPSVAEC